MVRRRADHAGFDGGLVIEPDPHPLRLVDDVEVGDHVARLVPDEACSGAALAGTAAGRGDVGAFGEDVDHRRRRILEERDRVLFGRREVAARGHGPGLVANQPDVADELITDI
ncbi:MAG: hypothetical protein KC729_08330, partial [Candidatus Eisenbacteria bacterium]|nr:hypothetical protein [Candidatus Eisenbacteria bacterium]